MFFRSRNGLRALEASKIALRGGDNSKNGRLQAMIDTLYAQTPDQTPDRATAERFRATVREQLR